MAIQWSAFTHRNGQKMVYEEEALEKIAAVDPRWRPMSTAPRDGTTVEVKHEDGRSRFLDFNYGDPEQTWYHAWRPAHPEWNEDPNES